MTITVGDELDNGRIVIARIDEDEMIVDIVVPADTDPQTQQPLRITFTPSITIGALKALLGIG